MRKLELIPAIVLSSHTMGLAVIRGLGMMGVPVVAIYYEKNDMGYVSKYVDEKILAPHPEQDQKNFLKLLLEIGPSYDGSILIPADDATQTAVAQHKKDLEKHYVVACPDWNITKQFIDKQNTYALAESIGVPAPKTLVPESLDQLEYFSKSIQFPCLIKPCQSHRYFDIFRKKMTLVDNSDEMLTAYAQASQAGLQVMIQEHIPGDDTRGVNYNSYFWNKQPLVEVTAEKVRLSPPRFGIPRVLISKDIPEIIEPGRKILRAMGFYGYSCTEFKKDERDGIYKLMEVNGRHNRSGLLSIKCGTNFPWIEYRHLIYGDLVLENYYKTGVYWIDITADFIHSVKYRHEERYKITQYIKPYISRHVFAVLDWHDLKPFIKRCFDIVKMGFRFFISLLRLNFVRTFRLGGKPSEERSH